MSSSKLRLFFSMFLSALISGAFSGAVRAESYDWMRSAPAPFVPNSTLDTLLNWSTLTSQDLSKCRQDRDGVLAIIYTEALGKCESTDDKKPLVKLATTACAPGEKSFSFKGINVSVGAHWGEPQQAVGSAWAYYTCIQYKRGEAQKKREFFKEMSAGEECPQHNATPTSHIYEGRSSGDISDYRINGGYGRNGGWGAGPGSLLPGQASALDKAEPNCIYSGGRWRQVK